MERAQLFSVNEFVSDTREETGPDTGKNGVRPGLFSREGRSGMRFRPLCFYRLILCRLYKKTVFVCYIGRFTGEDGRYIIKIRYEIDLIKITNILHKIQNNW